MFKDCLLPACQGQKPLFPGSPLHRFSYHYLNVSLNTDRLTAVLLTGKRLSVYRRGANRRRTLCTIRIGSALPQQNSRLISFEHAKVFRQSSFT